MNVRTEYMPGVYKVIDDDTGEIVIFSFWGQLPAGKLYELEILRRDGHKTKRIGFEDYC